MGAWARLWRIGSPPRREQVVAAAATITTPGTLRERLVADGVGPAQEGSPLERLELAFAAAHVAAPALARWRKVDRGGEEPLVARVQTAVAQGEFGTADAEAILRCFELADEVLAVDATAPISVASRVVSNQVRLEVPVG